jgi:hypothetical protein
MFFDLHDLFQLFQNAVLEPLAFLLFWALILCLIPRITRWSPVPLLFISFIVAMKDLLEPNGWNFAGTVFL